MWFGIWFEKHVKIEVEFSGIRVVVFDVGGEFCGDIVVVDGDRVEVGVVVVVVVVEVVVLDGIGVVPLAGPVDGVVLVVVGATVVVIGGTKEATTQAWIVWTNLGSKVKLWLSWKSLVWL